MNRYPNIAILRCGAGERALQLEDALRECCRVLAIGRAGAADPQPDLPAGEELDLSRLRQALPAGLHPDLFILPDAAKATAHTGVENLKCPTLAFMPGEESVEEPDLKMLGCYGRVLCQSRTQAALLRASGITQAAYFPVFPASRGAGAGLNKALVSRLFLSLFGKRDFPSEEECAEIEAAQTPEPAPPPVDPADRSFVIAVLDESPASPYNISTLLADLENISGDVICVFNDPGVAEKFRKHGRITRYAVLSQNAGVGRAWNVGLMMATSSCVFFLNSDLRIGPAGADRIQQELMARSEAAVAGPCGGFTDFAAGRDLYYLDAKRVAGLTLVDQVSGFYFAVKRDLLSQHGLLFHPEYLPCYMEEWDLALQVRSAGYSCLRVFIDDYSHEWGGSTKARRIVSCLGTDYALDEVLAANKDRFMKRWAGRFPDPGRIALSKGLIAG